MPGIQPGSSCSSRFCPAEEPRSLGIALGLGAGCCGSVATGLLPCVGDDGEVLSSCPAPGLCRLTGGGMFLAGFDDKQDPMIIPKTKIPMPNLTKAEMQPPRHELERLPCIISRIARGGERGGEGRGEPIVGFGRKSRAARSAAARSARFRAMRSASAFLSAAFFSAAMREPTTRGSW